MLLMKRFLLILTVAAMMIVVMAASALPAFAALPTEGNLARAAVTNADSCFLACYAPTYDAYGGEASLYSTYNSSDPVDVQKQKTAESAVDFCQQACDGPTNP